MSEEMKKLWGWMTRHDDLSSLQENDFLMLCKRYVSGSPEVLPKVTQALTQGLAAALESERKRSNDFEIAAICMITPRMKKKERNELFIEKVKSYVEEESTSLNPDYWKKLLANFKDKS